MDSIRISKTLLTILFGLMTGLTLSAFESSGISVQTTGLIIVNIFLLFVVVRLILRRNSQPLKKRYIDRKAIFKEGLIKNYYDLVFIFSACLVYVLISIK